MSWSGDSGREKRDAILSSFDPGTVVRLLDVGAGDGQDSGVDGEHPLVTVGFGGW